MALQAKNKLGFIDGTLKQPAADSTDLLAWARCNSMVTSWLIHSTTPSIANNILWTTNVMDVWDDLSARYSQQNAPHIFEIRRSISNHSQGTESISVYYTTLKAFRDELSSYQSLPSCTCGAMTTLHSYVETDALINFLQGLNDSCSAVRSQILLMDPLPTLVKAYSLLLQEEQQRSLQGSRQATFDQSALVVQHSSRSDSKSGTRPRYYCNYCNIDGHSDSRCFKQHGYPANWTPRNSDGTKPKPCRHPQSLDPTHFSAANTTQTDASTSAAPTMPAFTADQVQQLLALLPTGNTHPLANLAGTALLALPNSDQQTRTTFAKGKRQGSLYILESSIPMTSTASVSQFGLGTGILIITAHLLCLTCII
ncbi:uncharacterized protein LOC122665751 [Telopea speciosissima]|uniref:uncharacterized protein LOC122665751 n=1 Tax=Telopea speciosissima TaxID=54955 RepID=UPI001CC55DFB|nr:uncharacterized protein LOC122665751 [Telopea speciosissima]